MSDVNKAYLRRAAEAAPKGEWKFDCAVPERHFCAQVWDSEGKDLAVLAATEAGSYAAQHIAAANPSAVLSLLDESDSLQAERDQLRAELEAIRGQQPDAVSVPRELLESAEECIRAYGGGLPGADAIAGKLRALLSTKNAEEDQPCDK